MTLLTCPNLVPRLQEKHFSYGLGTRLAMSQLSNRQVVQSTSIVDSSRPPPIILASFPGLRPEFNLATQFFSTAVRYKIWMEAWE